MILILINIFILLIVKSLFCNTVENRITDEQRLIKNILNNYDSLSRPTINASQSVQVKFEMSLIQIYKLDDVNQVLTVNAWLRFQWKDERLSWDPKDYNGLKTFNLPSEKLWLPDIVLYNNADDYTQKYLQTKAIIYNDGKILWVPPAKFSSTCKIDATYFPFDDQSCSMKFGSWTYDGSKLDLVEWSNSVDTSDFIKSGEWQLISVRAKKSVMTYPCCKETYQDITYTIQMRRRTLYYLFNIILPCLWLTILSLFIFWLPPDSGEKITLGITVLLAFSVFMLLIADKMPVTSKSVPLIGIYLTVIMATTSLSIVLTVLVLHIHHIGPNHKKIPPKLRRLFFDILAPKLAITTVCRYKIKKENKESNNKGKFPMTYTEKVSSKEILPENQNSNDHSTSFPYSNSDPMKTDETKSEYSMFQRTINQYSEIIRHLHHLDENQKENELDQEMMIEWKMMAYVLDRCLFWIFAAIAGSATIIILLIVPLFK